MLSATEGLLSIDYVVNNDFLINNFFPVMVYSSLINSTNRNKLITSHITIYLLISFHRTNQWKVNHHMKKLLIGKLLLCNQRKVSPQ